MPLIKSCDVAVIGGGVVGLAAANALSERGADVRCLEGSEPGSGQSTGRTRIFRHAHEQEDRVRLAGEARVAWRRWEDRAGRRLVGDEGLLVAIGDPGALVERLERCGVPAQVVQPPHQAEHLGLLGETRSSAVLDPGAGAIRAARTIATLVSWLGDRLVRTHVFGLRTTERGVRIETSSGIWEADRVIVCAGTQTDRLASSLGVEIPVSLTGHLRLSFPMKERVRASCWIDHIGDFGERVYGSPVGSTGLYAIGLHGEGTDPPIAHDAPYLGAEGDPLESADRIRGYVERAMPGLDPDPVEARMCVITALPWGDDTFAVWQEQHATFIAGTNMFKFAPVLGTMLADAALSGRVPAQLAPPATAAKPSRQLA